MNYSGIYTGLIASLLSSAALFAGLESFAASECNPSEAQGGYCNLLGDKYDILKKSTVLVSNVSGNGSGTLISREGSKYTLITAGHVVNGIVKSEYPEYPVITHDGNNHIIKDIRLDENADLAQIDFESSNIYPVAAIGKLSPRDNGKIALAGFPLIRYGATITELCKRYSHGCWSRLNISKTDAVRLGLNPNFYPDTAKPLNIDKSFMLSFTSNTGHDYCNIFDFSIVPAIASGYNVTYNCTSYPGMSGGGVWRERDGKLIGVHGLGLGLRTTKNGQSAVYKAGLNMAISLSPRSEPTGSSVSSAHPRQISNSYIIQNARFLLEKGDVAQASLAYSQLLASSGLSQLQAFGINVNRLISLILQEDLDAATKLQEELENKLATLRVEPDDNSYSMYLTVRDSFLLARQVLALAGRSYADLDNATYRLEELAIEDYGVDPPLSRNFARLNHLAGQILAGRDWRTGTPRNGFSMIEPSYLGFTGPAAELTALYKLENWLKAIEIHKQYEPYGAWTKKEMACRKLSASLMKSYYKDPLEDYIDNVIAAPAVSYCLSNGANDFLNNDDILPYFLMLAL